jgi:protein-S-isoprenylcysteine O-methyltransferase Ste14
MPLREEMVTQGNFLFKYRSYLPIFILIVSLFLYVLHIKNHVEIDIERFDLWEFFSLGVCLFGLLIRCISIGYAQDNTSGRNTDEGQIADSINTTGLYSTCRHPLYLGNFFMWLGLAMFTSNTWFVVAFVFMYWVYYERIMFAEEEYLRGKFGASYEKWASQTPAFIPSLSKWTSPKMSFSLKKIIRQEKAGILNLFLVIYLFKRVAHYFVASYQVNKFWSYAFATSIAWYLLIKLLQKTTSIFEKDR